MDDLWSPFFRYIMVIVLYLRLEVISYVGLVFSVFCKQLCVYLYTYCLTCYSGWVWSWAGQCNHREAGFGTS